MSFAAKTITFQNNPVTWLQIDGAYPAGITLGDMTLLPEKPTTLTLSVTSLTAHNSSGGLDTFTGHGLDYSPEADVAVTIEGTLTPHSGSEENSDCPVLRPTGDEQNPLFRGDFPGQTSPLRLRRIQSRLGYCQRHP